MIPDVDRLRSAAIVIGAIALLAAAAALGGWIVGAIKDSELAELRREYAEQIGKTERDARERLQLAQNRGDTLTNQLTAANAAAGALQKDLDDALSKVTSGRDCLGGAALRVLDRAPGIAPAHVPQAAGLAAAADAGNAAAGAAQLDGAAGDAATDTDVARWSLYAAGEYGECVRRYHALIDWHASTTTTNNP